MKSASLAEVQQSLGRYVEETDEGPVIITEEGRPRAALVSLDGQDLEAFILAHSPALLEMLDEAAAAAPESRTPLSVLEAELGMAGAKAKRPRRRPAGRQTL